MTVVLVTGDVESEGQEMHLDDPTSEYEPALQSEQGEDEAGDARNLPAPQSLHASASVAPDAPECLPLPHGTQSDAASLPVDERYLPGRQSVHTDTPADAANLPLSQDTQSSSLSLPVVARNLPASQSSHDAMSVAPAEDAYLPLPHGTQSDAALLPVESRNLPGRQSLQTDTPADAANLPFSQATQSSSLSLPVVLANLPASHLMHTAAALAECVPASHSRHVMSDVAPVAQLCGVLLVNILHSLKLLHNVLVHLLMLASVCDGQVDR